MKIEFNRKEFIATVSLLNGFVSTKNSDSVLCHVKLTASESGDVEFFATNLETGIVAKMTAEVSEKGSALFPPARVLALLKESQEDTFIMETESGHVVIKSDGGVFTMNSYIVEDFPVPPETPIDSFIVPYNLLKTSIKKIQFCSARESSRYTLNGILFDLETSGKITLVATDGKRLGLTSINSKERPEAFKIIVPEVGLKLLSQVKQEEGDVTVFYSANHIQFLFATGILVTLKLLEGRFPEYANVLPKGRGHEVKCEKEELLSKIKQASFFTDDRSKLVKFSFDRGVIRLSANYSSIGDAVVSCNSVHPPELNGTAIGLNPQYVQDIVASWEGEYITFFVKDNDTAVLVEDGHLLYLIMPIDIKA